MSDGDPGELLTRALGGDEVAWRLLVRGLSALVLAVAKSYRLGEADAFDVCQHTWLSLTQLPAGLRDPAKLPGWLATTARRQALRVLSARNREIPCMDREDPAAVLTPESSLLRAERDRVLWEAVARLPERERELVRLLSRIPPASHAEIAAHLEIPPGSVGPLRRRVLNRLRRLLEIEGYDHA